jgi:hypothetical protein
MTGVRFRIPVFVCIIIDRELQKMITRHILLLLFGLTTILSGCALKNSYVGKHISPVDIITIQRNVLQAGTWKTFDIVIDYEYSLNNDSLMVSGSVELGQHYQMVYDQVRSLWVSILLLDGDGTVIRSVPVSTLITNTQERFSFNRTIRAYAPVNGLSFAYYGQVTEFDGHSYFSRP